MPANSTATKTSVLIVGAGPAGLTAAALLAAQGTPAILLEERSDISPHPRAIGFTATTIETFRKLGIDEDTIPCAPADFRLLRRKVESLAGKQYDESMWSKEKPGKESGNGSKAGPPPATGKPCSYVRGSATPQDKVERALMQRSVALGADVRMAHRVVRVEQSEQGVTVYATTTSSQEELVFQANYLIAADGTRSPIREALGIKRRGRGHIRTIRSVLFKAPALDSYLATDVKQFSIEQPGFKAFMTSYGDSRWALMFEDDRSRAQEELRAAIVRAVGRDDVDFDIITTGRWQLGALIAETYQCGRIFLAGDAAHQLPPNRGGYGANTGIADAYNLAWKLTAVVNGQAHDGQRLLATYDRERRPIAWLRMLQLFARPDFKADAQGWASGIEIINDDAMEFGQRYQINGEITPQREAAEARHPDEWKAAVGTRLPHVWIRVVGEDEPISTLQLGRGGQEHAWKMFVSENVQVPEQILENKIGVFVLVNDITEASPQDDLKSTLALSEQEQIVLVRPDDIIAWRGPVNGVREALAAALCH